MKKICSLHFKKGKTKIQPKALASLTQVVNIVVLECALRSGKQAFAEDSRTVTLDIVQKIIPQLLKFILIAAQMYLKFETSARVLKHHLTNFFSDLKSLGQEYDKILDL